MLYNVIRSIHSVRSVCYVQHVHYILYVQGEFLRSIDVYLRTHSPYLDSSFPYSKS